MNYMPLKYSVTTVSKEDADHHCRLLVEVSDNNSVSMSGCWPITGANAELNLAIKNPTLFATQAIQQDLKQAAQP